MAALHLRFQSVADWSGRAKAEALARLLIAEGSFWLPERVDDHEPQRYPFDPNDLTRFYQFWESDIPMVFLKRRKPYPAWLTLIKWPRGAPRFNEILGGVDERYATKGDHVERLLSGARRLSEWGAMAHGFIAHEADWNAKNYFGAPTRVTNGKAVATGGLWLKEHLPGIYWANIFGPVYVNFFGADKFRTLPAYHKEELPDGGFLVLTAPNPFDYGKPEVQRLEQKIIDHLGREAFFERTRPRKPARAPRFDFEPAAARHGHEVVAVDLAGEMIPDADRFLAEVATLADELARRHSGLDYSPASLARLDDLVLQQREQQNPWQEAAPRRLAQQLSAYYGEVLRRNLHGRWAVVPGTAGVLHPAVVTPVHGHPQVEYPYVRIARLWLERERSDGTEVRYHLIASGQLRRAEDYLPWEP